jgi:hypothetical protein
MIHADGPQGAHDSDGRFAAPLVIILPHWQIKNVP